MSKIESFYTEIIEKIKSKAHIRILKAQSKTNLQAVQLDKKSELESIFVHAVKKIQQ